MNNRQQKKTPINHLKHYEEIMLALEVINDNLCFNLYTIDEKLNLICKTLEIQLEGNITMLQELDMLTAAVARENDVTKSAVALIQGIATKLDAAIAAAGAGNVDPAVLKGLADSLNANADALAAAVVANTEVVGSTGGITS